MDIIGRAATLFGNLPALRTAGRTLSFTECNIEAQRIASLLNQQGVHSGEIVAIMSPNSPELVIVLLGLLKAGIIAAPLNNRFPEQLLQSTVAKLHPRLLLTADKGQLLDLPGIESRTIASILEDAALSVLPEKFDTLEAMERSVTIIHTSASSGEAKAAVHSFANHWYSALGSNENLPFGPGDCWLLSLPLYHIGGYSLLFRAFVSGASLAIGKPDESIAHSLENFPLTHLSLVPTQLYRLLADKKSTALLQRLKALLLGGSSAPKSLIEVAVRHNIALYLSYGSTEMSSQISTSPAPISGMPQNSGKVLHYRELISAEDGELLVKGHCLFQGYLRDGAIEPQTDSEGWFHTTDIGSVTDEGWVSVVGRKDNMFISGGENIHPEETEHALVMIEGIREALVVPVPDKEFGERPAAFILTDEENKPDNETITREMHSLVGKLKTPVLYFRVSEWALLPGSQKINRAWYRKLAKEQ